MIILFHMFSFVVNYFYKKLKINSEPSGLFSKPALPGDGDCYAGNNLNTNALTGNDDLGKLFHDIDDEKPIIKFSPPVFVQRYNLICSILRSSMYCGKIHKVIDFGCSELNFFKRLKHIRGIHEIVCVDIDRTTLEMNAHKIIPLSADYLNKREYPLKVDVYEGSVTHRDERLRNADVVICIELIEHLYPETLNDVPENIFGFIKPRLAIFTTPNADFNVLFPNMKSFRHDDHKFEWTRNEFEKWGKDIVNKYPEYKVKFKGIAPGPSGTEQYGCCSQMAIFTRRHSDVDSDTSAVFPVNNSLNLVTSVEYPFYIDDRPQEVKILESILYFIRRYQLNNDLDENTMPFSYLEYIMNDMDVEVDTIRKILTDAKYEIIEDESGESLIVLPELPCPTSDSDSSIDNWGQSTDVAQQTQSDDHINPPNVHSEESSKLLSLDCKIESVVLPSTSWSPEIITDSGYPNTYSTHDLTPEYDLSSITKDIETDSDSESIEVQLPQNHYHDGIVENGDLANNNRDNEGNNVNPQMENDHLDDIQPLINVLEIDIENENDIYDFHNGFPLWLLRIHEQPNN